MLIGVAYYPEHWDRERWETDRVSYHVSAHRSQVKRLKSFSVKLVAPLQPTRQSIYWRYEPEEKTE